MPAEVAAFVDAVAAADLVTFDGTKPVASLIPIIWDRDTGAPRRREPTGGCSATWRWPTRSGSR